MKRLFTLAHPNTSYLSMLFWFIVLILLSPFFTGIYGRFIIATTFSLIMISILCSLHIRKASTALGYLIILPALFFNWYSLYSPAFWVEMLSSCLSALFLFLMIIVLFKSVFLTKDIDANLIYGSICIYIMLVFFFALFYGVIELIALGSFSGLGMVEQASYFQEFLYFSFVTQSTLGYGDIVPVSHIARNIATLQAIGGQFYLAILVAGLIGSYLRQSSHIPGSFSLKKRD